MELPVQPSAASSGQAFRVRLAAAVGHTERRDRLDALARLSEERLGFVETIQLDRALRGTASEEVDGYVHLRVALLSSNTVEHLLPPLRVAGLRRGLLIEAFAGAFGQFRTELLSPDSSLRSMRPDVIVLSLSAHQAIAGVGLGDQASERAALDAAVSELRELWNAARERFRATVVQQTFLDVFEPLFGAHDRLVPGTPSRLVARLNDQLADVAAQDGVLLLDVARAASRDGLDSWFDVARWLQGKMEIAPTASGRFGELLARILAAQRGRSRKCLVLDLDNTIWGGVVGDVGMEGLVLGAGSARGEAHLGLQKYAAQLKQRGVILAVCSKNAPEIAERAFREHPEMALRRDDIAAFVANWDDKVQNIRRIAQQLNIGLDSLVFVDDNPAERARVRGSLPMVAVPELPEDPAYYVRALADCGYFESIALTEDDRLRNDQYGANVQREAIRGASQSLEEFLRGMQMTLSCGPAQALDVARITQLINKTNQFNTTGRRRAEDEVAALANAPASVVLQFRLADRFGDNGLVSAMVLISVDDDPDTMEIDSWVMSCRVFGRQLEQEAMNVAVEVGRARGLRWLRAGYRPTERNKVIENLFEELGFERLDDVQGSRRYVLELERYVPGHTFIARTGSRA